jgi:hydrogenase maturation protease
MAGSLFDVASHGLAPTLIFGIGNPSRGDDALGPLLIQRLAVEQAAGRLPGIELLTDFQLQPEHALDLRGRSRVLFVDAGIDCAEPYAWTRVEPCALTGHSTHSTSPGELLAVYRRLYGEPPAAELLQIRAYRFELGERLGERARANLEAASQVVIHELGSPATA